MFICYSVCDTGSLQSTLIFMQWTTWHHVHASSDYWLQIWWHPHASCKSSMAHLAVNGILLFPKLIRLSHLKRLLNTDNLITNIVKYRPINPYTKWSNLAVLRTKYTSNKPVLRSKYFPAGWQTDRKHFNISHLCHRIFTILHHFELNIFFLHYQHSLLLPTFNFPKY